MRTKVTTGTVNGKTMKAVKIGNNLVFNPNADIEEELYRTYNEVLQTGNCSNNSFLGQLIKKSFNKIENDVGRDADLAMTALKEVGRVARATNDYYNKKKTFDADLSNYLLRKGLFKWQKEVFDDSNHKKTMLCGRRSGKSYCTVELALDHCLEKSSDGKPKEAIIIGLTVEKTAAIYWSLIKEKIEEAHIPTTRIDNGSYTVTFTNGNTLTLWGNNSKADREKLRGKDCSFIAIDEMQSQSGLYYLITDILGPIIKGRDGYFVFLGTAPLVAGTMWEKLLQDENISHFHATMEDNPTIPNYVNALRDVLEENRWTEDNITFRREYLGEIAYDTERMIYPHRTYYEELPKANFVSCYIGVDYGWRDYSSYAPILVTDKGECYLIDEWKQNKTAASELVRQAKLLVDKMHTTYDIPVENIHIVQDTSHQQIGADFQAQGISNIENAYKQDEQYQIARVSEALELGDLKIKKEGHFDCECNQMVWKWNQEKGCVVYQIDDDSFHPDIADSVKYAYNQYITEKNCYA